MKKIEMIRGAKKLLEECVNVQKGENVLIVTDTCTPPSISEVLAMATIEREAVPIILIMSPVQIDGTEPPLPVGMAMQKAQIILLATRGIFHSTGRTNATKAGARCLIMSEFTEEDMYQGPIEANFLKIKDLMDKVASKVEKAQYVRVTTAAGTDIHFDLKDRLQKILKFNGVYHQPGDAGSINLELAISPAIGKSQGLIVCDASTTLFKPGLLKNPVQLTVEDGIVSKIEGGDDGDKIANLLASAKDPMVYNVIELAIGFNPKTTKIKGLHQDKGIYGSCHIGIGSNITWGGDIKTSVHADFLMYAPKIEFDGYVILENYHFNI